MNNYHIYEEIGKGKYSTVYKGRKKKSIEYVAVKSLDKSRKKKILNEVNSLFPFKRQVQIFHNLSHINILRFYNWYETRNHFWVIFEYCAGGDLFRLIEQDKSVNAYLLIYHQLAEPSVKSFGKDLLNALLYLHSNGILYCDLKPSNVLIDEFGALKLCDFGLAKQLINLHGNSDSDSGPKKGTPFYMAPELFQDEGVHSFASDLWALGCVLYEMATGKPPFSATSFNELANLILNSDTPTVEKFSPEFNELLNGLLEKDPSKRISWEKLKGHQFWTPYEFPNVSFPPQPHFENYLKAKGLLLQPLQPISINKEERPQTPHGENKPRTPTSTLTKKASLVNIESSSALKTIQNVQNVQNVQTVQNVHTTTTSNKKDLNILRLSQNAMKNLIRETDNGYNKENKEIVSNDIKLINKDQELNFAEKNEEEEEDDTENVDPNQDDNIPEEVYIDNQTTKVDFSQNKTLIKTPESHTTKTLPSSNLNIRKMKPELDELSATPKNGRSQSTLVEDAERLATSNFLSHQRSQSTLVGTPSNANSKPKIPPVDQLLIHTSDNAVKPITGNKEIEKQHENIVNKDLLPFTAIHPDDIQKGILTQQIESHLAEIYNALATSNNTVTDKLNVLSYFEAMIRESNVANRLVNSPFMGLLLKLCRLKNAPLKIKLCIIIGELIRHATVIDHELSQLGLPAVMAETLKDTNEKVRRKAIAALGEYLFYGATQMDEDDNSSVWEISSSVILLILKILKANEDEVVKFYTCKTVENITAQSLKAGVKFATIEYFHALHSIYVTTKNEALKISIVCAFSHIARLNNSLIWPIIEKVGINHIAGCFHDSNPRIQQAFITLLNMMLQTMGTKSYTLLAEEKALMPGLLALLDNSNPITRGKALLTFYLMFKINLKWMMIMSENKFTTLVDKLSRDQYKYVQCCLIHVLDVVGELVPLIQKHIQEDLTRMKKDDGANDGTVSPKQYTNYLNFMPLILGVMNSSFLRNKIVNQNFLVTMFEIYDLSEVTLNSINDDFRNIVFMIFESFSANNKLVTFHHEVVVQIFFPCLVSKITSQNADTRFSGIKLLTDMLITYLNEDSIYDASGTKTSTKIINDLITKDLLPNIKYILSDQEPMPLYGLKLFSIIIGKNIGFVTKLKQKKMLGLFLEYFTPNHPRLTANTLKIISRIVECRDVTLDELVGMNFVGKAAAILKHFWSYQQEWCYDELLDILLSLISKIVEIFKANKINIVALETAYNPIILTEAKAGGLLKQTADFLELIEIFASLSNHAELSVADKSLTCLLHTIYLYGSLNKKETLISNEQATSMISMLASQSKQPIWKKLSKTLLWLAYLQDYKLYILPEKKGVLYSLLDKQKLSEDKALGFCCK